MTQADLESIVAQYERNGWVLRRILLTAATRPRITRTPAGVPVSDSDLDAAWFSRPPQAGTYAWEVRYLGPTPFALVEHLDDSEPDFEQRLRAVEDRLRVAVAAKARGH